MPASHEELRHLLLADNHGEVEAIAVQDLLVRMMQDLSLRQREILSRWISGYTVKEIAVMLGYTSDKAVHQHLRRARQVIRDRMSTGVDKV